MASNALSAQPDGLRALDGEWIYVEDRTEGRALEQLGPPMSSKFSMRIEEGAVVLNGHGSGHRDVRIALDGSITEVAEPRTISRYRGAWKDGAFEYEIEFVRVSDNAPDGIGLIRREFRITADGLLVRVVRRSARGDGIGWALPPCGGHRAARAGQGRDRRPGVAGRRVGRNEERGVRRSRSDGARRWAARCSPCRARSPSGKMGAFEYLRIVERDGGLVYIAQPGGATPTEFVLTELSPTRAVFDNPRHDYPKRIVYELSAEGGLSATIGFTKGGSPRRFEFKREGSK